MTHDRDEAMRLQEATEAMIRMREPRGCVAYPCPNATCWFYIPAWSHLCMECMVAREAAR